MTSQCTLVWLGLLASTAVWPLVDAPRSGAAADYWSYRPVERPPVPQADAFAASDLGKRWVRNPIDAFILAEQVKHGLSPSQPADAATLLRRVYLDLIG